MTWEICVLACVITICIAICVVKLMTVISNNKLKKKEYEYLLTYETVKNKLSEHNYKEKISFNMEKFNTDVENKIKELQDTIKKKESNYDTINQKLNTLIADSIIKE